MAFPGQSVWSLCEISRLWCKTSAVGPSSIHYDMGDGRVGRIWKFWAILGSVDFLFYLYHHRYITFVIFSIWTVKIRFGWFGWRFGFHVWILPFGLLVRQGSLWRNSEAAPRRRPHSTSLSSRNIKCRLQWWSVNTRNRCLTKNRIWRSTELFILSVARFWRLCSNKFPGW